jgi:hypothetical protein
MTEKEAFWSLVLDVVVGKEDQIEALQKYIQEGGPIPDAHRERAQKIILGAAGAR